MNDATIGFVLAGAFTMGCTAGCGLRRRPEIAIRAVSVLTLGVGLFLVLAVLSRVPETADQASVQPDARR